MNSHRFLDSFKAMHFTGFDYLTNNDIFDENQQIDIIETELNRIVGEKKYDLETVQKLFDRVSSITMKKKMEAQTATASKKNQKKEELDAEKEMKEKDEQNSNDERKKENIENDEEKTESEEEYDDLLLLHLYRFLDAKTTNMKNLNHLFEIKDDNEFENFLKSLEPILEFEQIEHVFKTSGLYDLLSKLSENFSVIDPFCGLALPLFYLNKIFPTSYCVGSDFNKYDIQGAPLVYQKVHENLFKDEKLESTVKLCHADARTLPDSIPDIKSKKFDVILLINPQFIDDDQVPIFENILSKTIPKLAHDDTIIYLSCYLPIEMRRALRALGIPETLAMAIPKEDDPVVVRKYKIVICGKYSELKKIQQKSVSLLDEKDDSNKSSSSLSQQIAHTLFSPHQQLVKEIKTICGADERYTHFMQLLNQKEYQICYQQAVECNWYLIVDAMKRHHGLNSQQIVFNIENVNPSSTLTLDSSKI